MKGRGYTGAKCALRIDALCLWYGCESVWTQRSTGRHRKFANAFHSSSVAPTLVCSQSPVHTEKHEFANLPVLPLICLQFALSVNEAFTKPMKAISHLAIYFLLFADSFTKWKPCVLFVNCVVRRPWNCQVWMGLYLMMAKIQQAEVGFPSEFPLLWR